MTLDSSRAGSAATVGTLWTRDSAHETSERGLEGAREHAVPSQRRDDHFAAARALNGLGDHPFGRDEDGLGLLPGVDADLFVKLCINQAGADDCRVDACALQTCRQALGEGAYPDLMYGVGSLRRQRGRRGGVRDASTAAGDHIGDYCVARHGDGAYHDVERAEFVFDVAADEVLVKPESRVAGEQAHGALVVGEALMYARGVLGLREVGRQGLYLYVGDLPDMFGHLSESIRTSRHENEAHTLSRQLPHDFAADSGRRSGY